MLKKAIGIMAILVAIGPAFPAENAMADPSTVFVTSAVRTGGGFGGLAGADSLCSQLADAASLEGSYTAWMSDSSADAASRVYHNPDGYITTTGEMVAIDWDALINAETVPLLHEIDYDENGTDVGTVQPWTGTYETGAATAYNCGDWTSSDLEALGTDGLTNDTGEYWSEYVEDHCDNENPLYCFQDAPPPPVRVVDKVPTLNEWGMMIFMAAAGLAALWSLKRRRNT